MNLSMKQRQSHKHRGLVVAKGGAELVEADWGFGIRMRELLYAA